MAPQGNTSNDNDDTGSNNNDAVVMREIAEMAAQVCLPLILLFFSTVAIPPHLSPFPFLLSQPSILPTCPSPLGFPHYLFLPNILSICIVFLEIKFISTIF
jgi:hypothetical protein